MFIEQSLPPTLPFWSWCPVIVIIWWCRLWFTTNCSLVTRVSVMQNVGRIGTKWGHWLRQTESWTFDWLSWLFILRTDFFSETTPSIAWANGISINFVTKQCQKATNTSAFTSILIKRTKVINYRVLLHLVGGSWICGEKFTANLEWQILHRLAWNKLIHNQKVTDVKNERLSIIKPWYNS